MRLASRFRRTPAGEVEKGIASGPLLSKFGDLIADLRPEIVTMENVRRLQSHAIFGEFLETLKESGYHPILPYREVVRCADYGVPQTDAG